MSITTKGEPPATTGTMAAANVPADNAPAQQTMPLIGAGGAGMNSADSEGAECQDGHPVDVFTGSVVDEMEDLFLTGLIPVSLTRLYNSSFAGHTTVLGVGGWTFSLLQWIEQDSRGLRLRNDDARFLRLPAVGIGQTEFKRSRRLDVHRPTAGTFSVYSLDSRLTREFATDDPSADVATAPARLRRIVDRHGNHVTLTYAQGLLTHIADTAGRQLVFHYDAQGRALRVEAVVDDKVQQHVDYDYHPTGELARATNALGYSDCFEYDGKHRMVKTTLKNGVSFYYQYEPETDQCIKTWGDGGLHTYEFKREYHSDHVLITTTGADEPRIRVFNLGGDLLSESTYDGSWKETKEFDEDHFLLSRTNAAGEATRFEYDARGNRTLIVDPAGNETRWEYTDDRPARLATADGLQTRYQCDAFGEFVGVQYATGAAYAFSYDRWGRLHQIEGPEGTVASFAYDHQHNVATETDGRLSSWTYTYDPLGRPLTRTDPLGSVTRVEYDALGQPVRMFYADGTSTERAYNSLGKVQQFTDPLGLRTQMEYVGTGSLSRQVAPDGTQWDFGYDTSERLRSIKNPKAERYEFEYDAAGRVRVERTFDQRLLEYSYELSGRLHRVTQPDKTWREYSYDKLGNVAEEDTPHGKQVYQRDSLGRLQQAILDEGPVVQVSFERDAFGRIVKETQGQHAIEYAYDTQGRRLQRTVPGCGTTRYHYDLAGALSRIQHEAPSGREQELNLERDALGREVARRSKDTRVEVRQSYDAMDRLIEQAVSAPPSPGAPARTLLSKRSWKYDAAGRVHQIDDSRWGTTQYQYDRLGQLTHARRGNLHEVFEYQANGSLELALNVLDPENSATGPGRWDLQEGNLLTRTDKHEYEYDECHRRVAKTDRKTGKRTQYIWDCRDRLREVRFPDGKRARYFYDAFGRRVRKEVEPTPPTDAGQLIPTLDPLGQATPAQRVAPQPLAGTEVATTTGIEASPAPQDSSTPPLAAFAPRITEFLWDGDELAAERDTATGDRGHVHYPGTFVPLMQIQGGQVYLVVTDHLGTPKDLLADDGSVRWSAGYTAWGKIHEEFIADQQSPRRPPSGGAEVDSAEGEAPGASAPPAPDVVRSPFRLLGQYYDEETGFAATRFRFWDAETGRWASPDPLGIVGGANLNGLDGVPTRDRDPYGLACREAMLRSALDVLKQHLPAIRAIFGDDASVGIKGSLSTGQKHSGGDFDPNDFDVDAFVVVPGTKGRDFASDTHASVELDALRASIERDLTAIPGFDGLRTDPQFDFQVRGHAPKPREGATLVDD